MDEKKEFSITITGRKYNTWQGEFKCGDFTAAFLSELDLIHLMENHLNAGRPEKQKTQNPKE